MKDYSEKFRERKLNDEALLEQSYLAIADAVLGKRFAEAFRSADSRAHTAIEEVFRCLKTEVPDIRKLSHDPEEALAQYCRPAGIQYRTVRLSGAWYRSAFGAMLGQTKDGSIVALIPRLTGGYGFYDYTQNKEVHVNSRTAKLLEEDAVFFYKPLPARPIGLKDLLLYATESLTPMDRLIPLALTLVITFLMSLTPVLHRFLLGEVIAEGRPELLVSTLIFLASLTLTAALIGSIRTVRATRVSTKITLQLEAATMMRLLSLPARFFRSWSAGELAQRAGYIAELCNNLFEGVFGGVFTTICSFAYLGSVSRFAPALLVPAVAVLAGSAAVSAFSAFLRMRTEKARMEAAGKENGMSYALINGIPKIRLAGAETRIMARWAGVYAKEAKLAYDPPLFLKLSGALGSSIVLAGNLAIWITALKTSVSPADFYAFNTAFGMISAVFANVSGLAGSIAGLMPLYTLAKPILDAQPELHPDKQQVSELTGRIELSKVSFTYSEKMQDIIHNLSLTVEPGEFIAVVGKTGCGKSTLIRLLLGFETPKTGAVYYDGTDLVKLDLRSLRSKIGVVLQDGKLFSGDIFSNIAISAPRLTLDEAWEAAESAGIADDIRRMPMGMNTVLSDGGGGISGGQRQRLLIARAIASKPRVLILDEATSALDNVTQAKVSQALDALKCTRVVIAHRLSTIRHADRIVFLENGSVAESGTYEELMAIENGKFRELVARQQLNPNQ